MAGFYDYLKNLKINMVLKDFFAPHSLWDSIAQLEFFFKKLAFELEILKIALFFGFQLTVEFPPFYDWYEIKRHPSYTLNDVVFSIGEHLDGEEAIISIWSFHFFHVSLDERFGSFFRGKWRSDCRPFVWRILTLFPPPVRRRPVVRSGQDLLPEHAERFLRSLRVLLRRQKVLRLLHQNRFSAIIWIYSILSFAKTVLV